MEKDFKNYIEKEKINFLNHIEIMKPNLYTKDKVIFENFVIAYDQMFNALMEASRISSNCEYCTMEGDKHNEDCPDYYIDE